MESIDMLDAMQPQTILAYVMNGRELPLQHGAPVRLRVERQVGYKSVKYLQRIVVSDEFVDMGDTGWSWYVGI
jgi:DMSO/TMAO reductase YedYZ molybdopterin-dependent catalytic subunit